MSNANFKCVRRWNFGQFYGARSRFYDIRAHPGPEKFTLVPFSGAQYCVTFKQREPLLLWSFLRVFAALLPWMCVRASVYMCAGRKGTRMCQWQLEASAGGFFTQSRRRAHSVHAITITRNNIKFTDIMEVLWPRNVHPLFSGSYFGARNNLRWPPPCSLRPFFIFHPRSPTPCAFYMLGRVYYMQMVCSDRTPWRSRWCNNIYLGYWAYAPGVSQPRLQLLLHWSIRAFSLSLARCKCTRRCRRQIKNNRRLLRHKQQSSSPQFTGPAQLNLHASC
jgi:hypothetical protein